MSFPFLVHFSKSQFPKKKTSSSIPKTDTKKVKCHSSPGTASFDNNFDVSPRAKEILIFFDSDSRKRQETHISEESNEGSTEDDCLSEIALPKKPRITVPTIKEEHEESPSPKSRSALPIRAGKPPTPTRFRLLCEAHHKDDPFLCYWWASISRSDLSILGWWAWPSV